MKPIEVPFNTARDLFDYLSPLNSLWDTGKYVFRGQPSDQYQLVPSVCRRGVGSFAHNAPRRIFGTSTAAQVDFEIEVLKRFLDGCDRSGLIVPGYTPELKRQITDNRSSFLSGHNPWPPANLHQILAVAQHYDVPTRLLDWTDKSFVACYFAASSVSYKVKGDEMPRLAIWALDTTHSACWESVEIIRTPGGTSKNQAAQSGLFTAHRVSSYSSTNLDEAVALESIDEIYQYSHNPAPLMKITLPINEAPDLLHLCSKFGVDGSTLFPGYHGVAKSVRDWANSEAGSLEIGFHLNRLSHIGLEDTD